MSRKVIEFSKYNPSGNMTILVHSQHDSRDYANIANQLMTTSHVCCEQVGFIESTNTDFNRNCHLVMSGNEFCGNATMSYIHYLQESNILQKHQCAIKVSGCTELVQCEVHSNQHYEVSMPQAQHVSPVKLNINQQQWHAIEIVYESYVHFVVPVTEVTTELQHQVEQFVRQQTWSNKYKTIGIMLFDEQRQFLKPLIFIPEIQSLVWENSCGSGTASIGIFKNYKSNSTCEDFIVHQPGGNILVTSRKCPKSGFQTSIKGQVSTVATGKVFIE
ncbi:histidine racemase CntK [Staphylococcus xylosus]|uniref:histidine racemase CntK n=1 Tax=Staphylococcus xylosus TaxID=1288 RepID=UPI002DBFF481|nr:histidine racemase CntK [Staphylococcus xylosus]MEB7384631.1 histidine racemase CntK [Staphylococcus xylosus]MEB7832343.1 histidine racemase CntK [Staphylococcus xylosus]